MTDSDPQGDYTGKNGRCVGSGTNGLRSSAGPQSQATGGKTPQHTELIAGKSSISQSLAALEEKYSFGQVILATTDGLMLASSSGTDTILEAAKYSEIFASDPLTKTPGIVIFGIEHKGSRLVGIIRTETALTGERESGVKKDTQDILNWWL